MQDLVYTFGDSGTSPDNSPASLKVLTDSEEEDAAAMNEDEVKEKSEESTYLISSELVGHVQI